MAARLIAPCGAARRRLLCGLPLAAVAAPLVAQPAAARDPWDALLRAHVAWDAAGVASTVDYRGLAAQRPMLAQVLSGYSAVTQPVYDGWSRERRLAFLVNAYNAFTIELILTRYPGLKSIKDLGSILESPWKKPFFRLFGQPCTLDRIEHEFIRAPGAFDDPRIHFAVVCASVGCPALRPEAWQPERLDEQLNDSMKRFLRDRRRNRYEDGALRVSRIFDWYRGDFEKGYRGIASREALFAANADLLSDDPAARERIRAGRVPITFLDYDWSLNDRR